MNTLRKHANRWSIALTAALAYVPLLLTEPGRVAADTKQYLYLDPSRLLSRAATMWDSHIGLGTVTHQNIGYLFPMGPYYWLMERLGVPDWVAQRLWLGSIMFLAALGVRYLMRTLGASQFAAGIAGLVYMLSPYSLDYAARISVILLPWAALGWMLGLTIRAAHLNRWREAAAFALVVQVVGGVNATALIFAGLAPLLWLGIAVLTKSLPWRRVFSTTARIGVMSLLTSLWWMAGLSMQGAYGIDILRFTETVKAVSGASMSGEVLRGLGYWFFYGTDKVGPWIEASGNYTQSTWLIAIGYLVPAAALAAAVLVRWRHRRFFISLMVLGMAIAVGTHPYANPAPFGALLKAFARASSAGLALRSTGRAVPIVSLGIAAFCGVGAHALRAWLKVQSQRSVRLLGTATGAIVTVIAVAGFTPIWNHEYYASSLLRNETIPKYWTQAIADADKGDHKTRIFEVPGSDFATYRWGGLVDPVTPGLTDRPYLARELIPWGSPASADLVNAFDRQLQEGALEPTAVQPMARLFAAGTVLARNDLQIDRYNLVRPNEVATVLEQGGLQVAKRYGFEPLSPLKFPLLDERTLGASGLTQPQIPSVVRYEVPGVPKILAVVSANQPVIIEGDGEGVVNAAASGFVPSDRVVIQAASLATEPESLLREAARPGAQLVVTDTNRKRARRWSTVRENTGMTERANERLLRDDASDARLDLFPGSTTGSQTVAVAFGGEVDATGYGNPVSYTPENRPSMAFDGDPRTAWKVGDFSDVTGELIRLRLPTPAVLDHIVLVQPLTGPRDRFITQATVSIGRERIPITLTDASRTEQGQTIALPNHPKASTISIAVRETNTGLRADYGGVPGVGFAEVRVYRHGEQDPVQLTESVQVPTQMLSALGTRSARAQLSFVFDRVRTQGYPPRSDEERSVNRQFVVPTTRSFSLGGVVRLNGNSLALDELVTRPDGDAVTVQASSALGGAARARPFAAIDGSQSTMWQPAFGDDTQPWISLSRDTSKEVGSFHVSFIHDDQHSSVTSVTASWDGGTATAPVIHRPNSDAHVDSADVQLPAGVAISAVRFTVTGIQARKTLEYFSNSMVTLPIGVTEITSSDNWMQSQPVQALASECRTDLVSVDGEPVAVAVHADTNALLRGERGSVTSCAPIILGSGTHTLTTALGIDLGLNIDHIVMSSDATGAPARLDRYGVIRLKSNTPADHVDAASLGDVNASVRLSPSTSDRWVVLRQSFNAGWSASGIVRGPSTLVNGYANGWLVPAGEHGQVVLQWTPQRRVWSAIAISLVSAALAVLLAFGVIGRRRRERFEPSQTAFLVTRVPEKRLALRAVMRPLLLGALATFLAGTAVGATVLLLGLIMWQLPHRARLIAILGPVCALVCGAYIIIQQVRYSYPPQFEWPTRFDRVHPLGWLAVMIPALYLWTTPSPEDH